MKVNSEWSLDLAVRGKTKALIKQPGSQVLVAHACNPSHSGTEIRRTAVQEQPKPKKKK
jgi:hypothetical protein